MSYAVSSDSQSSSDLSPRLTRFYILSFVFHGILVGATIFFATAFRTTVEFKRPQTFSLVSARPMMRSAAPPVSAASAPVAKPVVSKGTKPVPATKKKSVPQAHPKEQATPQQSEERLDELSDLLSDIPASATEIAAGAGTPFKYPWYLLAVQQKVEQFWRPPVESPGVFVVITFLIFNDGSISGAKVTASSKNQMLDNLALRAVQLAAPFGKLPPGFDGDQLEINYTFRPLRK